MLRFHLPLLLGAASTAAAAASSITTEGTLAFGGGGALLDGNRPAWQRTFQHQKDGYGGLEDFTLTRRTPDTLFRVEARAVLGDADYRLAARWERFDAFYVDAGHQTFRTFYDGSGGFFLPRSLSFDALEESLHIDRASWWFEIGTLTPSAPQWRLRYARQTRQGNKSSTRWGDSNLVGAPYTVRSIVPATFAIDETRDIVTLDVEQQTDETTWAAGARVERSRVANANYVRRRPTEPQSRYVTARDEIQTDLFTAHSFFERTVSEQLRYSAGGLISTLDTNTAGSRIDGPAFNAAYNATFAQRQAFDMGFYGLLGGTQLKQYIGNLNFVYEPRKHWSVRPTVKYEHLRKEGIADFIDTNVLFGTLAPVQNQVAANSANSWNEFTEEIEVRTTRWPGWVVDLRGLWSQGTGHLVEQSVIVPTQVRLIDRDTEYDRFGQKYTFNAAWYPKSGFTLSTQYYFKLRVNDYRATRDNTPDRNPDRYPHYVIDQDLATHDVNLRVSWRPAARLAFVARYELQQSDIVSTLAGHPEEQTRNLTRHIAGLSSTWTATSRLYLTASLNRTSDRLETPVHRFNVTSESDYFNGSVAAGYALGKVTDLYLDYTFYRADNAVDHSLVTLPLDAEQRQDSVFLTWVRRHRPHLTYTGKLGYGANRDAMTGGINNYDAFMLYGKVQYSF